MEIFKVRETSERATHRVLEHWHDKYLRYFFILLVSSFSLKIIYFISFYLILFLVALGLHCCTGAFSSCSEWGPLFIVGHGLLTATASLAVGRGLWAHGLSRCSAWP